MRKCIDVWMMSCVAFVFLSLIELALVCRISRRQRLSALSKNTVTRWLDMVKSKKPSTHCLKPQSDEASKRAGKSKYSKAGILILKAAAAAKAAQKEDAVSAMESGRDQSPPRISPVSRLASGRTTTSANGRASSPVPALKNSHRPNGFGWLPISPQNAMNEERKKLISAKQNNPATNRLKMLEKIVNDKEKQGDKKEAKETREVTLFCLRSIKVTADQIDNVSLIAFPLCFVAFNIIYWLYYVVIFRMDNEDSSG